MSDYKQKLKELKEDLEVDESKPHYVSLTDKTVYYRESETHNDRFTQNMKKTLKDWAEKGYVKYKGKLQDIKREQYLRFINSDGKVLNGGFLVKNNTEEKFMFLRGVGGKGFSIQYDNIKDVYYNKEQYEKAVEKAKNAEKKKQEKEQEKEKKQQEKEQAKKENKKSPEKQILKKSGAKGVSGEIPAKKPTAEEVDKLLNKLYYEEGHYNGRDRLYQIAKEQHSKITRKQVEDWLKAQKLYQLTKPNKSRKTFTPIISTAPFNVVQIDIYKYGDIITLNMIDLFSKYVDTYVMKNETAKETIVAVKAMLKKAPMKPKLIQSDNGSNFKSKEFKDYLAKEDIKQLFSTPYTPQSQGSVERLQKTLKSYLEKLTLQNKKITNKQIAIFNKNYNNTKHSIIGMTPMDAIKPENKAKVLKAIEKAKAMNLTEDRKDDLEKNDKVRLSTKTEKKNSNIGAGSLNWTDELFKIHSISRPRDVLKPIKYKVEGADGRIVKGVFYRNELQKIESVENAKKVEPKYEVKKLIKKRVIIRKRDKKVLKTEYLVRWKGYTSSEDTWENEKELIADIDRDAFEKLKKEYLAKKKK